MISRLADQKWPDLAGRRPLVVLPLGSCEQHGPHLPLDTDHAVAEAVAGRAAALLAEDRGLLIAPGQRYGASGEHEGFPGTVSIGHTALSLLIGEIGRSVLRWAGRLLVVNGHGGNLPSLAAAIAALRREGRDAAWWPCEPIERLRDRLIAESVRGVSESGVLGDPSRASGHQGEELLSGMAVQLASDIRAWRVSMEGRLGYRAPGPPQPGAPR